MIDGSFQNLGFVDATATSNEPSQQTPKSFKLEQNYPNPFNPTTTISFSLAKAAEVKLQVFDVKGSLIKTILNEQKSAGDYSVQFDASNLSSGTYLYKLETPNGVQTKKMTLIK